MTLILYLMIALGMTTGNVLLNELKNLILLYSRISLIFTRGLTTIVYKMPSIVSSTRATFLIE